MTKPFAHFKKLNDDVKEKDAARSQGGYNEYSRWKESLKLLEYDAEDMFALLEKYHSIAVDALKALEFVRHRDARWHDDDVVTPAISSLTALLTDKDAGEG